MKKTILITGATDGIGLETAKMLVSAGHDVLLHGRNPAKLAEAQEALAGASDDRAIQAYLADLSRIDEVETLANAVAAKHDKLDVLINNAGVLKTPNVTTEDGLDIRFVVNTLAPYLLTQRLLPLLDKDGRVINLSSAAQSPVDLRALRGQVKLADMPAYAQSKLALTMWSRQMGQALGPDGPVIVAVNPGSMLGTKMVKEGFGAAGGDIRIGADILTRAALEEAFADASGQYFDNDAGRFAPPHPDALDAEKSKAVVQAIEEILGGMLH
ncbi:MAG: SDR family NAD(P)-dependent oxidoreductase [Pseudomonadota bacterium]